MNRRLHIHRRSILRTVRTTKSRFFAILAIVFLGVGFLSGLLSAPVDMRGSADAYYDSTNMYDLRVLSTLGLTDDDLAAVSATEGVKAVQAAKDTDMVLTAQSGDTYTTRVLTLPENTGTEDELNRTVLQSGRMPEKDGECVVVETKSLLDEPIQIGDVLTPDFTEVSDLEGSVPEQFTVVGIVKSSTYLSMEKEHTNIGSGVVDLILCTPISGFTFDYYTALYVSVTGARELGSFGSEYDALVSGVIGRLDAIRPARVQARHDEIVNEAQSKLDDAKAEYESKKADAEQQLADAEQKLEDGRQELADAEQTLADSALTIRQNQLELSAQRQNAETQFINAQAQIDTGYQRISEAEKTLADGEKQLADAQAQIDSIRSQLDEADRQLAAAKAELDRQEAQIGALEAGKQTVAQLAAASGMKLPDTSDATILGVLASMLQDPALDAATKAQLTALQSGLNALAAKGTTTEAARAALTAGESDYAKNVTAAGQNRAALEAQQTTLSQKVQETADGKAALAQSRADLDAKQAELTAKEAETRKTFDDAAAQISEAWAEYADGKAELEESKATLADAEQEYNDKKAEADEKLADAANKIRDAQDKIDDIEDGKWYLWDRSKNTSYASYDSNAEKIGNIAKVFPVFFFLVAALVALTTMTRMVEEERLQIGTLKALGYDNSQIAAKYLWYAGTASIAGSILGMAVGMKLFPYIVVNAYNIMYDIPKILIPYNLHYGLIASTAAVACTMLATLNACRSSLQEVPARLMLPRAPRAGRRILLEYVTPVWSRMSFIHKVTARNLFRYKRRFFMTVFGIAGCTALLVTGFGLKDSISDIVTKQFDDLDKYQLIVTLSSSDAAEGTELQAILSDTDRVLDWMPLLQKTGNMVPNGGEAEDEVYIVAPKDADIGRFRSFYTFRHRTDGSAAVFDENSVVITEKLAERQHLAVGDTMTVKGPDDIEASFVITDICENYVGHYLFIPASAYEKAFGQAADANTLFCRLADGMTETDKESQLSTDLLRCRNVAGTQFTDELSYSFEQSLSSIDFIVFVLIVSAAALAFVVLYNLTNINITEREKEIATIKVLGFYDPEVSAYIYRETNLLTLIGTALGLLFGIWLHHFVILTAEIDQVMFGRSIYPPSYLWSALLTIFFSVLVSLVMFVKMKHISMVESMKAPE